MSIVIIVIFYIVVTKSYNQNVLITGGAGFVGRHFTKKYCDLGYNVTIVDNMISESSIELSKWPKNLQSSNCNIKFYKMDCRDYFKSSISNHRYDIFIHLAAIVGGRATIEGNPIQVAEDLAIDSAAFIYAVERCKPKRMVYMSSSAAYPIKYQGTNDNRTILKEDMINLNTDIGIPDMSYGWAKLTGEYLAQLAAKQYGLNVSIYRPFSGYGEDQHIQYPFNSILQQVLRKEDPINLWSDSIRDFIHIDDIVDCVVDSMDKVTSNEAINLGSGMGISFSQLAHEMASQVGYSPNINILEDKPTGVHFRVTDTSKFLAVGCSIKISLQQGIAKSIEFSSLKNTYSSTKQASIEVTKPTYSQVFCTAGTQYIPCSNLQKTAEDFPYSNSYKRRVCRFQNVCRINGTYYYYYDPKVVNPLLSFTNGKFLRLGYKSYDWIISSQVGKVPNSIPYSNTTYNLLYETSFSDNFGHFLIDDMLPQLFAFDMWDIPVTSDDVTLVISNFCELKEMTASGLVDIKSPLNPSITRKRACMKKYKEMLGYIFDFPLQTNDDVDMCFKYLIAGQSHTFSLNSLTLGRGGFLRKFRNLIVDRSGLSHLLNTKTSHHHRVLVLTKDRGWTSADKFLKNNLCSLVKQFAEILSPAVEVNCFANVSDISFQDQLKLSLTSTLLITEHGTLSYSTLFLRDGLVSIVLAANETFKEPQILLHLTHSQVYYLNTEMIDKDLYPMMELGLSQASQNLGIEMPLHTERLSTNIDSSTMGIKRKVSQQDTISIQYLQPDGSTIEENVVISVDSDPFEVAFDYCALKQFSKIECKDIYERIKDKHRHMIDVCDA